MTEEKRGRGRPKTAQLKLNVAQAIEERRKKTQLKNLISGLRKEEVKPVDGASIIQDENLIKWHEAFKDLIKKHPDLPQLMKKNPELALFHKLYEDYAGTSDLMEEMLRIGMRKGIESIYGKRKSKETQEKTSAKSERIYEFVVREYIAMCIKAKGKPAEGYRATILKRVNTEFGKNTFTDYTYITKLLGKARKMGKIDPAIEKRRSVAKKHS